MERATISITMANIITITIIAFLGMAIVGAVSAFVQEQLGRKAA